MRKIFFFIAMVCLISAVNAQQKTTSLGSTQQHTKVSTQQPTNNNGSSNVSQYASQRKAVFPIPKKILVSANSRNLTLLSKSVSENVMDYTVSRNSSNSSPNKNQTEKRIQAGILGVVTKNIAGTKTSFVLTNKTSSWSNGTNFSKAAKSAPDPGDSDPSWNCNTITETLSAQSTSFLNASKNDNSKSLFPGAIYTFDNYASGNFNPIEANRNPVDIFTNTNIGMNNFTVQNPVQQAIGQAISNIVNQFSPTQGGATVIQQTLYTNDLSEFSITVSAGGAYDGYSGSNFYNRQEKEQHIYITVDATKALYTISVHRPANGYFINGQIPQTSSPLVMIQDVTYGARLLANLDFKISSTTDLDKFNFKYDAVAANANFNLDAMMHDASVSCTINSYMVGVPATTGIIKTTQDFQEQIDHIFSQSNYRNAIPISYTLTDMEGNILGIESMTDHFTYPECTPAHDVYTLKSVFFTLQTGADGKNSDSQLQLSVGVNDGSNNEITSPMIGQFSDNQTEYKSGSTVYATPIPLKNDPNHPNGYTLDDFANGGYISFYFVCASNLFQSDDWDIASGQISFNFVSQKGVPYSANSTVKIPKFRLSSSTNGFTVGKQTFWFTNGFLLQ